MLCLHSRSETQISNDEKQSPLSLPVQYQIVPLFPTRVSGSESEMRHNVNYTKIARSKVSRSGGDGENFASFGFIRQTNERHYLVVFLVHTCHSPYFRLVSVCLCTLTIVLHKRKTYFVISVPYQLDRKGNRNIALKERAMLAPTATTHVCLLSLLRLNCFVEMVEVSLD